MKYFFKISGNRYNYSKSLKRIYIYIFKIILNELYQFKSIYFAISVLFLFISTYINIKSETFL